MSVAISRSYPIKPSFSKLRLNVACSIAATAIIFYIRTHLTFLPCTFDGLCQLGLAEVNRRKGLRRINQAAKGHQTTSDEVGRDGNPRFIASVVGYREDPLLWKQTLKTYLDSEHVETIILGIDGNGTEDLEMLDAVVEVFGIATVVIALPEAYGPIVEHLAEQYLLEKGFVRKRCNIISNKDVDFEDFEISAAILEESFAQALKAVVQLARITLLEHGFLTKRIGSNATPQAICIHQPHRNKKEIMFSNFIVSLAVSSLYASSSTLALEPQIQYIWSSDSDTLVRPTTVRRTIACLAAETLVGGATCGLSIHNSDDSLVARLASAVYWSILSIKRAQPAVTDSVIVQPGASAAFRLDALEGCLMRWYTQRTLGVKNVVNEDLLLTTLLLHDSWKVIFLPDLMAITDAPSTLRRWIMQQIRWARAARTQCAQSLLLYLSHDALLFTYALLGFYVPLEHAALTAYYAVTGNTIITYQVYDLMLRMFLSASWVLAVQSKETKRESMVWLMLGQVFYWIFSPGIEVYSSFTFSVGEWGTCMGRDIFRGLGRGTSRLGRESRIWSRDEWGAFAVMAIWLSFVALAFVRWAALRVL